MRAALLLALGLSAGAHAEGKFAQLYPAKPPADMAYVRMVNPGSAPLKVKVAGSSEQAIGPEQLATTYALVKGSTAFAVSVGGKRVGEWTVKPGSFNTLVAQDGSYALIEDVVGSDNALKAELRFYNLAADCPKGRLNVADGGATLFADVAPASTVARAINPVSVSLSAACGEVQAPKWALPALKAGDHYALFLSGSAQAPVLRGVLGVTDPYQP